MRYLTNPGYVLLFVFFLLLSCRKEYRPPVMEGGNHYLSVDGFINTGTNATTTFTLTRSRNLSDTAPVIAELNAAVLIESSTGETVSLHDGGNGIYVISGLSLDPALQYRLSIQTSDGNRYRSDFVAVKSAPPIDQITWEKINDTVAGRQAVEIYVGTHDPSNLTRYYRWDYEETFEHHPHFKTLLGQEDGIIFQYTGTNQIYSCWQTELSSNILLGTSIALSQDVIDHALIAKFLQNDPKLDAGYSILVRQYPLTSEGYTYWLTVQKNSQSLGGLFDIQPANIAGNIHCITNPANPVLGFISASSVQEFRQFISHDSLPGWSSNPGGYCPTVTLLQDSDHTSNYSYADTAFGPYVFVNSFPPIFLVVTPNVCRDCRYLGGTNVKPPFWTLPD